MGVKRLGGSQGPRLTTMEDRLLERKVTTGGKITSVLIAAVPESQMQLVSWTIYGPQTPIFSNTSQETQRSSTSQTCLRHKHKQLGQESQCPTLTYNFERFDSPRLDNVNNFLALLSLHLHHFLMQASNFYFFPSGRTTLHTRLPNQPCGVAATFTLDFCRILKNNFQLPAKINVFLFQSQCPPLPPQSAIAPEP